VKKPFFESLIKLAEADPSIELMTGDLGFGAIEPFVAKFPGRFTNVGVAEQNLAGIACGMALSGKTVFTYSIANFPTLRCLEQLRNDVCYHNANVKVVAVGGGFSYGALGVSHFATEDISIMRSLPGMTVVAPGDDFEVREATLAVGQRPGPCYLRLGRADGAVVHPSNGNYEIGKSIQMRSGRDGTLFVTGELLQTAVETVDRLAAAGTHLSLLSMHTVSPIDVSAVLHAVANSPAIFTLEEHSIVGGLGSAVAELIAEHSAVPVKFKRIGLPHAFPDVVGSQNFMRARFGLEPASIAAMIAATLAA
jgi:transketolase